uniref:Uncharacterized protein n=1 Tax=Rhizophora mucronata TaxID=61149 RepID=A0A2P2N715_RHIMU
MYPISMVPQICSNHRACMIESLNREIRNANNANLVLHHAAPSHLQRTISNKSIWMNIT